MPRRTKSAAVAEPIDSDPLYVTALARGLGVLRCCADAGADLSVSEIARHLGLPQPTVWRSCYTLMKLGYLVRGDNERLRPGLAVLGLGFATLARQPLSELARPGMEGIATRFPGAVSLGVPQGTEMLYVARVEGGPVIYPGLRAGSRVGMLSSAMGWAYLAALAKPERRELLSKTKAQAREQHERIATQLGDAIRYYEQHGVLINSGVIHPELNAIAVAIMAKPGTPVASISFGGIQADFPARRLLEEVAPQLVELAVALSASVGQQRTLA